MGTKPTNCLRTNTQNKILELREAFINISTFIFSYKILNHWLNYSPSKAAKGFLKITLSNSILNSSAPQQPQSADMPCAKIKILN